MKRFILILILSSLSITTTYAYWSYGRCYHCDRDDGAYLAGGILAGAGALIGTGIAASEARRAREAAEDEAAELRELRRELRELKRERRKAKLDELV